MRHPSYNIARNGLGFPEHLDPTYLQDTAALEMWRSIPVTDYTPERVANLLADAMAKRDAWYAPWLQSRERNAMGNF